MLPHADDAISRDGKSLILAYDHGLEHGPVDFDPNPSTADPERLFELASHDAVTALAVQKGIAEAYYPDYEEDVNLLLKLNGTSSLWMGEPDSPVNCSAEYAADPRRRRDRLHPLRRLEPRGRDGRGVQGSSGGRP